MLPSQLRQASHEDVAVRETIAGNREEETQAPFNTTHRRTPFNRPSRKDPEFLQDGAGFRAPSPKGKSEGWGQRFGPNRRGAYRSGFGGGASQSRGKAAGRGAAASWKEEGGVQNRELPKLRAAAPEFVPGGLASMGQPAQVGERGGEFDLLRASSSRIDSGVNRDVGKFVGAGGNGKHNREAPPNLVLDREKAVEGTSLESGRVDGLVEIAAAELASSGVEGREERPSNGGASSSYWGEFDGGSPASKKTEEPVLSEAERDSNEQEQQDEVMVLESIFAGDFQQTSTNPRTFELSVHVTLPASQVQVLGHLVDSSPSHPSESTVSVSESTTVDRNTVDTGEEGTSGEDHPSGQIRVAKSSRGGRLLSLTLEHLPPLRLTCTLPTSYPSHSPPKFTLSSVWLTRHQIESLCQGLDGVWKETPGQVVVYSWADWLSRETFETLGLGERFEIGRLEGWGRGKGKESEELDVRAKAEGRGVEDVLPRLLRYNEEKTMDEFRKGVHECQVCFSEQPGIEFVHLWPGCRHNFCRGCTTSLVDIHVREGSLARLTCPDTDCKEPLPPGVIKELLAPEQFQRWETLMLQKTFDSMSDVVYCPRCETPTIEEPDHTAQCQKCFFAFCSLCNDATHFGSECMDAETQLRILRERTQGRLPAEEQKRKEAALLNEILNMKYVDREAKKCPKCGMAIQKDEGCNKMTCWNCSSYFCYKCGKAISGYDHFNSGACVLFEAAEIDAWNRLMGRAHVERNEAQDRVEAQIEMFPNRVRNCPACRQPNVKEAGNNHLRCWSCQNHFCGACGKAVLKGSHHFGPKGCKQHTPD